MLEAGLVEEVRRLKAEGCHRGMVSMQGLGYKEILAWLDGDISYEEAVYILKAGYPPFCQTAADLVPPGADVTWVQQTGF